MSTTTQPTGHSWTAQHAPKLAADFADSGLDYDQLGAKVGHDARTARKIVTGKTTLTVYGGRVLPGPRTFALR